MVLAIWRTQTCSVNLVSFFILNFNVVSYLHQASCTHQPRTMDHKVSGYIHASDSMLTAFWYPSFFWHHYRKIACWSRQRVRRCIWGNRCCRLRWSKRLCVERCARRRPECRQPGRTGEFSVFSVANFPEFYCVTFFRLYSMSHHT